MFQYQRSASVRWWPGSSGLLVIRATECPGVRVYHHAPVKTCQTNWGRKREGRNYRNQGKNQINTGQGSSPVRDVCQHVQVMSSNVLISWHSYAPQYLSFVCCKTQDWGCKLSMLMKCIQNGQTHLKRNAVCSLFCYQWEGMKINSKECIKPD